jgi:signal transduction histidine kinase
VQQLAARLEISNRIKEEFLGVISHELRTPLNVVKGYVQLLQTGVFGELRPEQDSAIEKIAGQTRDQLEMITSILQVVSVESDVATTRADPVPLCDFLDDFQSAYLLPLDKPLSFRWDYSPELPVVMTDKTKLKYVLQNLINNAVKFTNEGQITVSAALLDSNRAVLDDQATENSTTWLKLDVVDTGIGIAQEFLPSIFEKFSQVDSSTTRAHGGIGLGLHIVKRCVECLHGKIKVESEPGKGSTFSVMIPCAIEAEATAADLGTHDLTGSAETATIVAAKR